MKLTKTIVQFQPDMRSSRGQPTNGEVLMLITTRFWLFSSFRDDTGVQPAARRLRDKRQHL